MSSKNNVLLTKALALLNGKAFFYKNGGFMKKLLVLILSVLAAFTAIISLTACGKTDFTVKFSIDGETYATVSAGGSEVVKMPADPQKDGYTFDGWFLDDGVWTSPFTADSLLNKPLKSDITVYAKLSVNHSHEFNKKIAEERFLKSAATCVSKAVYYFSCKCGEKGEQTFEYGEPLPHSYNADRICENCGYIKPSEGLRYVLNDDESGYICVGIGSCSDTYVVIPSVYNDLPVVAIGENAFSNTDRYPKNSIIKTTIPDSVTDIGVSAFSGCSLLTSINIPERVTGISDRTFYDCSSLTEIIIPAGVKSIGEEAFEKCSSLTGVIIPESVTNIGRYAFSGCNSLTYAVIPNGATCISDNLFYGCESLTDITIPDGVTRIGYHAFEKCSALASINIPDRVTEIHGFAFFGCTSLTSLTIPASVTSIGDWAFNGCRKLAEIINNSSLNIVEGETDNGCVAYYALSVKKGGTSDIINQGDYQFITVDGVNYLSNYVGTDVKINLPASYNGQNYSLGDHAFDGYTPLRSVTIPSSVTDIGDHAFYRCYNLTSITIPESVTNIGKEAFAGCYRLVEVINNSRLDIVKGGVYNGFVAYNALSVKKGGASDVVNQGDYQFITASGGNYLVNYVGTDTKITLPTSYNGQNYRIKNYAFSGCESLTEVIIPNGVASMGEYAFAYCRSLTCLTIPESVTSIGDSAFYCCTSLTSVNIPASITGIGGYAFSGCESLTEVIIPNGVASMGEYAFAYCRSLTSITIPASVTSIGGKAFTQCHSLTDINVNENNKNFKSIDGNLYSIGGELIQYAIGKRDASFVIPVGVTSIGDSAFYYCTWLKRVIIPVSVISIGDCAFYSCDILNDITYKGTVEQWNKITKGDHWFYSFSPDCVIHCEDGDIDHIRS